MDPVFDSEDQPGVSSRNTRDKLRESRSLTKSTNLSDYVISSDDFREIAIQIFKYSSDCIEEPKLYYSVFIKVR